MNYTRINRGVDSPRAERYRWVAVGLFSVGLAVLVGGVGVGLFYGSLLGVLLSLTAAGVVLLAAFVIGGIGLAQIEEPSTSYFPEQAASTERKTEPYVEEWGEPYVPPRPADENRLPPP